MARLAACIPLYAQGTTQKKERLCASEQFPGIPKQGLSQRAYLLEPHIY